MVSQPARLAFAIALLLIGAVIASVGLFAEPLGLGNDDGFGWRQLIATITGLVLLLSGLALLSQARRRPVPTEPPRPVEPTPEGG
ncbi:MAG: hypothetical protein M3R06_01610 [Chloroflexota bacterium]|nr:hypothetical protein [Chloroflexota bacterium]